MPTREQTINDAIQVLENAEYPSGLNAASAWLGIYQALLWYEPINWVGFTQLPHIIDADKLRPNSTAKKRSWTRPVVWQRRAQLVNDYLAKHLQCSSDAVSTKVDLLMKQPDYDGRQRQNTLGIAFAGLVRHVLAKFGSKSVTYETEVDANSIFPGITFPGRSGTPRIDILAKTGNIPRAIISAKWSLRHDRLNDITNECPVYKAAFQRIYRQVRREHFLFFVITNEYDPARLGKVLGDTCADAVVHVNKAAVADVCGLNGRLAQLMDMGEFINATALW